MKTNADVGVNREGAPFSLLRFASCLLGGMAAIVVLAGWTDSKLLYIGVTDNTPVSEISMVTWSPSKPDAALGLSVRHIRPASDGKPAFASNMFSNEFTHAPYAILKNGRYFVGGYCVLSSRDAYAEIEYEFQAGKRYRIECSGRMPRTTKLVVTET